MAVTWKKLAFLDEVATTFLGLSDTPASYATAGAYYKVNAGQTAVEEGLVAGVASGLATLDAASVCAQAPKLHAAAHKSAGADVIKLNEFGDPTAAVAMDGQQLTNHVIHTVADNTAMLALAAVVGKMCWRTDELHPYVCTVAV